MHYFITGLFTVIHTLFTLVENDVVFFPMERLKSIALVDLLRLSIISSSSLFFPCPCPLFLQQQLLGEGPDNNAGGDGDVE